MVWIAILAAIAVARLLEFLLSKEENWRTWDGAHSQDVTFWEYVKAGQLQIDMKAYWKYSWHFICKVMKEIWSCVLIVACWEMYWRLPMEGQEDVERQLMKILFLKGGSLGHQMYFQQCRTATKVENIEKRQSYMERRDSERVNKDRTRHIAAHLAAYDEACGPVVWLERHLRTAYATCMESFGGLAGSAFVRQDGDEEIPDAGTLGYWRMVCTEVCLRHCRDMLGRRLCKIAESLGDGGENLSRMDRLKDPQFKQKSLENKMKKDKFKTSSAEMIHEACRNNWKTWEVTDIRYLKNLSLEARWWKPLQSLVEWRCCNWSLEYCNAPQLLECKDQILERRKELEAMMKYALEWSGGNSKDMEVYMMEDMPGLVQDFLQNLAGGGGSSMESVVQQQKHHEVGKQRNKKESIMK